MRQLSGQLSTRVPGRLSPVGWLVRQLVGVLSLGVLAGCTILGAASYKLIGPMPVDPLYVPAQEPMVVMVERYHGGDGASESETLSRVIFEELLAHGVAPQIDPVSVIDLRSQQPMKFRGMTISQIGSAVGAKQVLYVHIGSSSVQIAEGSTLMRGQMSVRVKVIDVATGNQLWPEEEAEGHAVSVETPVSSMREGITPEAARLNMINQTGDTVAKLFYRYRPETTPME